MESTVSKAEEYAVNESQTADQGRYQVELPAVITVIHVNQRNAIVVRAANFKCLVSSPGKKKKQSIEEA